MKQSSFLFFCIVIMASIFLNFPSCKIEDELMIKLEEKFVLEGDGTINFYEPGGIAVDKDRNIYVADSGNQRVVKFDSQGGFIRSFGKKGEGPGEFLCPWQLAVYHDEIYVYDWGRNIQRFTLGGKFLSGFNLRGGIFLDFDIDSKGNIYVARWTYGEGKFLIEKFDNRGSHIKSFCEPEEGPTRALALILNNIKLCLGSQDIIWVAFRYKNEVRMYDSEGYLLREFNRKLVYTPIMPKHTPEDEKPFELDGVSGDIFCNESGRLFVTSNKTYSEEGHLIDVLNSDGIIIGSFYSGYLGDELPAYSELPRDQSIHIDTNQNFYVLDHGSMNVHVFRILFE